MASVEQADVKVSLEAGSHDASAKQFEVPVDTEHKAKAIKIFSFKQPHMRSLHLAWITETLTFAATFAPAALGPIIRENLALDKWQMGNAGVAAVIGAIACRMFIGVLLDTWGARIGTAFTCLIFAPAVFCMSLVENAGGFIASRLFIGCSLCMFVCCQYWVGSMFNGRIVGFANAIAAGWGAMGAGATQLIMPLLYSGLKHSVPGFSAWRWAFFIPGAIYIMGGIFTFLFGQDAPDGDFRDLKKSGQMASKGNVWATLKCALSNYRAWVLLLTYGYCFGVELTMEDTIVDYLYDEFQMNLVTAGALGALFGFMNIFSRASGGLLSDLAASRWGMRGRLWTLWILQTLQGVFCLVMSKVNYSEGATIAVMVVFSILSQQSSGATFGIVPFVSRRAYGVVSGMVGAGGNIGSVVNHILFFVGTQASPELHAVEGIQWMGVMTIGMTMLVWTLYWPMWGGMAFPAKEDYTEEDYYVKEWSPEEVSQNLHSTAMKFAVESRSQRGFKAAGAAPPLSPAVAHAMTSLRGADASVHRGAVRFPDAAAPPAAAPTNSGSGPTAAAAAAAAK